MFQPRLADLFEALVVIGAAAHAIEILRNHRVIGLWQCEPVEGLDPVITGSGCHAQPDKMIYGIISELLHLRQISNDHIGTRHQLRRFHRLHRLTAASQPISSHR